MRRLGVTIATAAAVAALAPASQADTTRVIRLISTFHHARVFDREPKGHVGAGDVIISVDRLANAVGQFGKPKGAVVGHDRGRFTMLSPQHMRLDGWTTLPGGRIHVTGLVRMLRGKTVAMKVVGGAGAFASARGTVTVTEYPDQVRTLVVYRLKLR